MIATAVETSVHAAVIRAADGIRFTVSGPAESIEGRLVDYIVSRCDDVLWPVQAREVRRLIAAHQEDAAIAAYFANVGLRWDEEWLELT